MTLKTRTETVVNVSDWDALVVATYDLHRRGLLDAGEYTINIDW